MAKVIEFYVPDRLREKRLWNPSEQRGKLIKFPPTEITGVTSQLKRCEAALVLTEHGGLRNPHQRPNILGV
jgi:hypothetical protein